VPGPPESAEERAQALLGELEAKGSEKDRAGMARYGIKVDDAFGVSIYELRRMAKPLRRDHELALALWATGNHEARLLATIVDDPARVDEAQMEAWVADVDSWDVCDQLTSNLFDKTPLAYEKAYEWAARDDEFVRRAAFALIAALAWQDKREPDERILAFLPLVEAHAFDERNFVKKAVNWALRNIGKRNLALNAAAVACAERIRAAANARAGGERGGDPGARSARWVAADALRELTSDKVRARIASRA
jgi:3-methyladenine DNA glycosylase AlkD